MEIKNLKHGDIFEIVRNGQQYEFIRFSIDIRPRDFLAKSIKTDRETFINLQTRIKAIKLADDSKNEKWFFTFGFGQPHEGCYHCISGEKEFARESMYKKFGEKWSMMYSEAEFRGQAEEYNLKEIK